MVTNKNLYPALVLDVNDPLNTGRIRAFVRSGEVEGVIQPPEDKKWTFEDPMVILPLIPMYFYGTPKVGEYVHVMFSTNKERYDNDKFYILGPLSRPWNNKYENYNNAQSVMAAGEDYKSARKPVNPKTGEVQLNLRGIYPSPGDNGLLGRGTADIIIKEDEVLIRAGKYKSTENDNIPVTKNEKRSFLQISSFELQKKDAGSETITKEIFPDIFTKRFVQWGITNLTSTGTTYDGFIKFYNLNNNNDLFKTSVIDQSFDILGGYLDLPLYTINFTGKTLEETTLLINTFIKNVNDGFINIVGYPEYIVDSQFPFYYGPDITTYQYVNSNTFNTDTDILSNNKALQLYNKITYNTKFKEKGRGLMWKKDPPKLGTLPNIKEETIEKKEYVLNQVNYSVLGGNKLYLLTHDSQGNFNINLNDTLYGISQDKLADYEDKTNSMVRGNELVTLLKDILTYLKTHVHSIPNSRPIHLPILDKIDAKLREPENTLLNKNIRIN